MRTLRNIAIISVTATAFVAIFLPSKTDSPKQDTEPSLRLPPATEAREVATTSESTLICTTNCPLIQPETEASDEQAFKVMLRVIAEAKGLPDTKIGEIEGTIHCESRWIYDAVGDQGTSFGLVQIHLPAHPHVTEEEAKDPEYALAFIVEEFLKGNEWKWTCWNLKYSTLPHSPPLAGTTPPHES